MDKIAINASLKSCLGKQLFFAKRRLYELQEISITELDLSEVVFGFNIPSKMLYFSWEQIDGKFGLSIISKSHLVEYPRPEISAEDDNLLSKLIGKRLTLFELYADEYNNIVAALLRFENESCVVAVGYEIWREEKQTAEFQFFSGDDLYLWTEKEFFDALTKHKLRVVVREEYKILLQ